MSVDDLDSESLAIAVCVGVLEPLSNESSARVLVYIGSRYLERLKMARADLQARIAVVEQHARSQQCQVCRNLDREIEAVSPAEQDHAVGDQSAELENHGVEVNG